MISIFLRVAGFPAAKLQKSVSGSRLTSLDPFLQQQPRSRTQSPSLHGAVENGRVAPSPKLYRSPWLQHQRRSHLIAGPGDRAANGVSSTGN